MNEHRPVTEAELVQLTEAPASTDTQPTHHGATGLSQRELDDRAAAAALASGVIPEPHPDAGKIRILWVFAWLVVGGEETEVRLLARTLDRTRYRIDSFQKTYFVIDSFEQLMDATRPDFTPIYARLATQDSLPAGGVQPGDRVGVVGRNGAGKSTLMKLFTGELQPDGGTVRRSPGVRVRNLQQDPVFPPGATVDSVLDAAFHDLDQLEAALGEAAQAMSSGTDESILKHEELLEHFARRGGFERRSRREQVALARLGPDQGGGGNAAVQMRQRGDPHRRADRQARHLGRGQHHHADIGAQPDQ